VGVRLALTARSAFVGVALASTVACEASRISETIPGAGSDAKGYPGFDIANYPGSAALQAWRFPSSPYYWVGYYLAAPCHRDTTWMGTRPTITGLSWGTAVIYVGQQDWSAIPTRIPEPLVGLDRPSLSHRVDAPDLASSSQGATAVTCSASLLSVNQGALEGADAVDKTAHEGFPLGTTIFLDVEYVTAVSQPLLDYYKSWIQGVLADGRFRPGVYMAKSNAAALYQSALAAYAALSRTGSPSFWIASSTGFSMNRHPTDVGLSYAAVWQGQFDVSESWNGRALVIDIDVATLPSPSSP
jgi:hypothetical protein